MLDGYDNGLSLGEQLFYSTSTTKILILLALKYSLLKKKIEESLRNSHSALVLNII